MRISAKPLSRTAAMQQPSSVSPLISIRLDFAVLTTAVILGTDDVWLGNPNTTLLTNATGASWSNVTFFVPDNTASDKRIGFLSSGESTDGAIVDGFYFYGSTAVLIGETGTLESSFYALQISERVHRLYWNDTSLGQVPVNLRSMAPSNPPN